MSTRSIKNFNISNIEKSAAKWLVAKRYKVFVLILLGSVLSLGRLLPFINLYLSFQSVIVLIFFFMVILLEISYKTLISFGLILFIPSLALLLFESFNLAELTANFIYFIFLAGALRLIFESSKNKKAPNSK